MLKTQVTTKRSAIRKEAVVANALAGVAEAAVDSPAPATKETTPDSGERRRMVAEAAYYRAAQRGFAPGSEVEDWLEAEAQIRARLGS
jgi:hypothetical protein